MTPETIEIPETPAEVKCLAGIAITPLLAIGERLRTQDNRCTANPMFIVQQQRSFGVEPGEGDMDVWLDEDWEEVDAEMAAKLDELDDAYKWEMEEEQVAILKRHTKRGIKHHWEFVMAAFTEEGCKEYLRLDGHNLTKPRIYAMSFNRCPEMLAIRETLLSLANANVDLPDTAAQDSDSKSNNPAVSG